MQAGNDESRRTKSQEISFDQYADILEQTSVDSSTDLGHATVTIGQHPGIGEVVLIHVVNGRTMVLVGEGGTVV